MYLERKNQFPSFIVISIVFHFAVAFLILLLGHYSPLSNLLSPKKSGQIIIEQIPQLQLEKLKTVGKKDGKRKNDFSSAVLMDERLKNLTLSALNPTGKYDIRKQVNEKKVGQSRKKRLPLKFGVKQMNKNFLRKLKVSPKDMGLLKKSDLSIHFETPKGVTIDELNDSERIFYSFRKRCFENYVSSFIKTYNDELVKMPYLKSKMSTLSRQEIRGKVNFSEKGDILNASITHSSKDKSLDKLFVQTLKSMIPLYNPPRAIIRGKKTFVIYFALKFN
jgi:hypothetical protein